MEQKYGMYLYARDLAEILGVSRAYAYKAIRELNAELAEKGYRVVAGRVPVKYFKEKYYGMDYDMDA